MQVLLRRVGEILASGVCESGSGRSIGIISCAAKPFFLMSSLGAAARGNIQTGAIYALSTWPLAVGRERRTAYPLRARGGRGWKPGSPLKGNTLPGQRGAGIARKALFSR